MTEVEDLQTAASTEVSLPPTLERIALVGFMGAGKSTVARLLAARLGWQAIDVDAEVERRAGRSIAEIFAAEGERAFRTLESLALARCLGARHAVIALGGGAPEVLANRLLLEQTPRTSVVFLDGSFPVLYDRCVLDGAVAPRPVLADSEQAAARYRSRLPFYRRVSHVHVDTDRRSSAEVATSVLATLAEPVSPSGAR